MAFASGIYQTTFGLSSLTIAFIVSAGGQKRVKQLLAWAEQTLMHNKEAASLFLFGAHNPHLTDPKSLFMDSTFLTPFENTPYALVETL